MADDTELAHKMFETHESENNGVGVDALIRRPDGTYRNIYLQDRWRSWLAAWTARAPAQDSFQSRVQTWLIACFGAEIASDKTERNHRFLEEALEVVQAAGCSQSEAHQLVDYVYGRPVGELPQEVGGAMNTLAGLCLSHGLDVDACAEAELARVWTKVEKIRAKQAAKPKHSPLPEAPAQDERGDAAYTVEQLDAACIEVLGAGVYEALNRPCSNRTSTHEMAAMRCFLNPRVDHAERVIRSMMISLKETGCYPEFNANREVKAGAGALCEGCPPPSYSTNITRCDACPRREGAEGADGG